jgi:MBOAT, membrane-bound O-acyltransferase family
VLLTLCMLAFVLPYAVATSGFPVAGQGGARGRLWFCLLCAVMAFLPSTMPLEYHLLRFLAAMSVAVLCAKLYDLRFDLLHGTHVQFREYLRFLGNPFVVVRRRLAFESRPARASDLQRLVAGLCGLAAGVAAGRQVFLTDWSKLPFLLEHSAKLIALYVPLLSGLSAGAAGWRLLGGSAQDTMDRPYLARTPAELWRRYNRNMQQFFLEDVFKHLGDKVGRPARIMIVFCVSALLHEYVFGIATGRVQGYQTAFFLLQGIAVAGTTRVRPRGWQAITWAMGTALFVLLSLTLFFASMQGVVPFYSRPFGGWSWEGWTRHETP